MYIVVDLIKLGEKCCRIILNLVIKVWLELRNIIRVVLGLKIILKVLEYCCFIEYFYRNDFFFFGFILVGDLLKFDILVDDLWDLFVKVK